MIHWLLGTRLESPNKLVPLDTLFGVLALVVLLPSLGGWLRRRRSSRALLVAGPDGRAEADRGRIAGLEPGLPTAVRRTLVRVLVTLLAGVAGLVACWVVGDDLNAFDVHLTDVTRMWVAFGFGGAALGVTALVQGGVGRRFLAAGLVPVALLVAALGVNVDYAAYPTLNALRQTDPYGPLTLGAETGSATTGAVVDPLHWHAPAGMPTKGEVGSVVIPGTRSGFPARPAVVYLPPAARTADPPVLPVLVSLSGQPGSPSDMFQIGGMATVLDQYAAAHGGLAPIVVSADQLAVPGHNPMCVDSVVGNAATYITRDVPDWIHRHLRVASDRAHWGLIGFSEGATCATQFLTGYPEQFSAALAISSERQPIDRTPQNSADEAFGGSLARWREASPAALMHRHGRYEHTHLWLAYGEDDREFATDAKALATAARHARITVSLGGSPHTGHDWNTVGWALRTDLPREVAVLFHA